MAISRSAARIKQWFRCGWQQAKAASACLPQLIQKPRIALHTVATAWYAHLILLAALLALIWWVPGLLSGFLEWLYPPKDVLFGLSKRADSRLAEVYHLLMILFWAGSGALTLLALWLHIPRGIASAARQSRILEQRGDALCKSDSALSLELYGKALSLASAPDQESALEQKIKDLGPDIAAHTGAPAASKPKRGGWIQTYLDAIVRRRSQSLAGGLPRAIGAHDRYHIQARLGQGGMGVVYRGLDTALSRPVALKGLPAGLGADDQFVARFHQEAKALAFLSHPCIVQVYDLVEHRNQLWIVLELVEGGDLAGYLERQGRLPIEEAARLGAHLAGALSYAHAQGVVHRDFKPSNVLLTLDLNPKITDFGLAKLLGTSTLTQSGTILGSPLYMSPEQASGHTADERSDAYAFGITLYEMVTGRPPFTGDTAGVLAQHLTQSPTPPREVIPGLPAEIDELILGLLRKDPLERTADLDLVSRLLSGRAAPVTRSSVLSRK